MSIEYKEFGIRLTLTPTVVGRDRVMLKVAPEVSELDYTNAVNIAGTLVPLLGTGMGTSPPARKVALCPLMATRLGRARV